MHLGQKVTLPAMIEEGVPEEHGTIIDINHANGTCLVEVDIKDFGDDGLREVPLEDLVGGLN